MPPQLLGQQYKVAWVLASEGYVPVQREFATPSLTNTMNLFLDEELWSASIFLAALMATHVPVAVPRVALPGIYWATWLLRYAESPERPTP